LDAVSLLPPEQVPEAADTAIRILQERGAWCSAYRVIQSASAQFPEIFAPWREAILDSVLLIGIDEVRGQPNLLHYQLGPIWRGAPAHLLDRVEGVVRDPSLSGGTRRTFAGVFFGSRDWTRIRKMMVELPVEKDRPLYDVDQECLENGFEFNGDEVRFLHGRRGYHLQFPAGFAPDCGVTSVGRLELIACIQCRVGDQFIRYSRDGRPVDFEVEGESFDFPPVYFLSCEVCLATTPNRWIHPGSAIYENRFRLNGPPDWCQAADYPECPECRKRMRLLFEIPSGVQTTDRRDAFMWGDGGTGYIYSCDPCRISSLRMQCA
jgi:hypothetical protein